MGVRYSPVCSSDAPGVDKPLSFEFVDFVLVGMSSDENIYVQLALNHCQAVRIAPRDNLMAMYKTDFELTYLDDFGFRKGSVVIKLASNNVYIRGETGKRK